MTADHGLGTLLARGARRLRASAANQGPGATPDLDAELLLTHVLGTSRARLRSHPEEVATDAESKRYAEPHRAPRDGGAAGLRPWPRGLLVTAADRHARRAGAEA